MRLQVGEDLLRSRQIVFEDDHRDAARHFRAETGDKSANRLGLIPSASSALTMAVASNSPGTVVSLTSFSSSRFMHVFLERRVSWNCVCLGTLRRVPSSKPAARAAAGS